MTRIAVFSTEIVQIILDLPPNTRMPPVSVERVDLVSIFLTGDHAVAAPMRLQYESLFKHTPFAKQSPYRLISLHQCHESYTLDVRVE